MNLRVIRLNIILLILNGALASNIRLFADLCSSRDTLVESFHKLIGHKKDVQLGDGEKSSTVIQLSWNSSSFKRYDECKFRVVAPTTPEQNRKRGLFVSIRRLNLRKNGAGECYDYVRFKLSNQKTEKYCGQLNASTDVDKEYFKESGNVIDVYIHLEKQIPLQHTSDTLDIELVFTANEYCNQTSQMTELMECYENVCISKTLQNDGINNCPPPFCADENGVCPKAAVVVTPKEARSNNTDIVISALTSLIFTLVGVGSCLWLCWHVKDCFLPDADAQGSIINGSSNGNNRRSSNVRSTAFNTPGDSSTASASNSQRPTAPQNDDKDDNPPSYDTLFPHLVNKNDDK